MPKIIKTKKLSNKNFNVPTLFAFAILKGLIIFVIGALFSAFMVLRSTQSNFFYYGIYFFIALGALLCSYDASKKIEGKGFVKGIISSGIYSAIIILLIAILMRFNISANILLVLPLTLITGFIGGNLGVK